MAATVLSTMKWADALKHFDRNNVHKSSPTIVMLTTIPPDGYPLDAIHSDFIICFPDRFGLTDRHLFRFLFHLHPASLHSVLEFRCEQRGGPVRHAFFSVLK